MSPRNPCRFAWRSAVIAAVCLMCCSDVQRAAAQDSQPDAAEDLAERIEALEQEIEELKDEMDSLKSGSTKVLLTGRASVSFTDRQNDNSTFGARFNPAVLWKLSDQILAGTSFELRLDTDETDIDLQWAYVAMVLSDHLTVRGGLFLTPLSYFQEQLYPAAINRLPDKPLFATGAGQLVPESSLGLEVRGASLLGSSRITYSAYVANGPSIRTSGAAAGQLDFRNFTDINNSKAVGGQIGFMPSPQWEFTYGLQYANVSPSGAGLEDVDLMMHALSASFQTETESIGGRLELRAEYIFADYLGEIDLGAGPFDNDRTGGYAQIAYRPTYAGGFLKDLEGVLRWDFLNQPGDAPRPEDEQRYTIGVDYWIAPTTVLKVAYQFDDVADPSNQRESADAFLMQLGIGF